MSRSACAADWMSNLPLVLLVSVPRHERTLPCHLLISFMAAHCVFQGNSLLPTNTFLPSRQPTLFFNCRDPSVIFVLLQ